MVFIIGPVIGLCVGWCVADIVEWVSGQQPLE